MTGYDEVWKVIQYIGESRKVRVIFEGLEKDARKFISDHFPRTHVEPGSPDEPQANAHLVSPSGAKEEFSAENGFSPVTASVNASVE